MKNIILAILLTFGASSVYGASSYQNGFSPEKNKTAIELELSSDKETEYYDYDFGRVSIGQVATAFFSLTNNTNTRLEFASGTISGNFFSGEHTCTEGIEPGDYCDIALYYEPGVIGLHTGVLELSFTPDFSIYVDLTGTGI